MIWDRFKGHEGTMIIAPSVPTADLSNLAESYKEADEG